MITSRLRWFLTPSLVQAAISVLLLPLVTAVLFPADFGIFALASAVTGLASMIACLGSSYNIVRAFSLPDTRQRDASIFGQVVVSAVVAVLLAITVVLVQKQLASQFDVVAEIGREAALMAAASIIGAVLWAVAMDVATLDGRGKAYGVIGIISSSITAAVTLWCLYSANLGRLALFPGQLAGSVALLAGSLVVLRRYATSGFRWRLPGAKTSLWLTVSNVLETSYIALERVLPAGYASVHDVGLYFHAQQYRTAVSTGVKALGRTIWPMSLEEAQNARGGFPRTGTAWRAGHVLIGVAGTVFAALGPELIHLLTNGRFVDAWPIAALGMLVILAQNSGRTHVAYMYAHGFGTVYAILGIMSTLIAVGAALVCIRSFGMLGAIGVVLGQQVSFRLLIQWYVGRVFALPFQDEVALYAGTMIVLLVAANLYFEPSLALRSAEIVAGCAFMLVAVRKRAGAIRQLASQIV